MTRKKYPKITHYRPQGYYLIELDNKHGCVCITGSHLAVLFPPFLTNSILARGWWEECDKPTEVLEDILDDCIYLEREEYLGDPEHRPEYIDIPYPVPSKRREKAAY